MDSLILICNYICSCWCYFFFAQHIRIMLFDDVSDIDGAAITYPQSVQVEILMAFVVLAEVFPHKLDEQLANIFFHILALWWVEPYNLSVSTSSSVLSIAIIERH